MANTELGIMIRRAINHEKKRRGLRFDSHLARQLGIHNVTLWRWTQGDVGDAAAVLLPLVDAAARAEAAAAETTPVAA